MTLFSLWWYFVWEIGWHKLFLKMCCGWLYTCSGAPLIIMHLNMLAVTVLMLFTYTASIFERHFSLNTRVASCFATAAIVVCVLDQLYLRSAEVISTCLHFSRVHVPSWCLCSSTATGLLTQHTNFLPLFPTKHFSLKSRELVLVP